MSRSSRDTPRPLQPPVVQRDIEAEVAHCVGGEIAPDWGSAVVRRARLHEVLRDEAVRSEVPIMFGKRLTGITPLGGAVRATFADGATAEADILVGCDGVNSPTRAFIDPSAPQPAYAGIVGVGGYARTPAAVPQPDIQHFVFGRRSFFGNLVREDGEVYWFANMTRPEPGRGDMRAISTDQWLAELRDLHAADPDPVPQILAATNTGEVRGYPVYDLHHVRRRSAPVAAAGRPGRVPRWSRGRVVAVGDAVHATSPSAGQGASLALEDSIVLTQCLRDLPTPEQAFASYQRIRQPRAEQVVEYAQQITKRKTVSSNVLATMVRDAVLPIFLRKAAIDTRLSWLYDHHIPWDQPLAPSRRRKETA